ncbi:MAG: alpha-glucosidase/alpha-galactosidase [Chloroflexi bacterium]|nr:alpha-glucosidase/alpha-galactosidase [Chloroflexota bacterium]
MSSSIKVTVIGAGSATFSLALVKDLCLTPGLAGSHVCFMDINAKKAEMVCRLATRYAEELGSQLTFEWSTDRPASLQDANFVINTATVKNEYDARDMREVIDRHGYYYGGEIRVDRYYNLMLMLGIARDMERICPDAWFIMAGNPVFAGTTLVTRETGIKSIGLCHGHYHYRDIAKTIGLDPDKVTFQAPGLNHMIWMTDFLYEGKDAYPLIDEWIATKAEEYWATHVATGTHDVQMSRSAVNQYKLYGLFPIGDTVRHTGWWYHTDKEAKMRWFPPPWGGPDTHEARAVTRSTKDTRIAEMMEGAFDAKTSVVAVFGAQKTREQHVPIIDGLVNNHEGQFQVNVRNEGALAGVAADVAVEVPAIVNAKGVQPLRVKPLPPKVMVNCILPNVLSMERTLLGLKTGDRAQLLLDVLESHHTRSYDQAVAVLEDVLAMPGYEEMAKHYRYPKSL